MLGHRERDRRQPRHYVISLYLAVVIAAHALALLVCSMCSPLMAVGILLNLRVNAVFPLYWRCLCNDICKWLDFLVFSDKDNKL